MGKIIGFFLEYLTIRTFVITFYYGGIAAMIAGYITFVLYFFSLISKVMEWVNNLIHMIESGSSSGGVLMSNIYCMLNTIGLTSGFNAGLPLLLYSVSGVLIVMTSKLFFKFAVHFWQLVGTAIKLLK
jgi:hypothetical protein